MKMKHRNVTYGTVRVCALFVMPFWDQWNWRDVNIQIETGLDFVEHDYFLF